LTCRPSSKFGNLNLDGINNSDYGRPQIIFQGQGVFTFCPHPTSSFSSVIYLSVRFLFSFTKSLFPLSVPLFGQYLGIARIQTNERSEFLSPFARPCDFSEFGHAPCPSVMTVVRFLTGR